MGVHGLWKLIEPSGNPVPLETLENKVLAVDVSIWLHQAIKGFQDSKGAPLPNAHLLGIYHRVCKLLYFKIKPVFVFDGGVPVLKKETIAKRNQLKAKHSSDANKIQKQILNTLLKHTAVNKVLSEQTKANLQVKYKPGQDPQTDDLFKLPPSQLDSTISSSEDEDYTTTSDSSPTKYWDIHTIDEKSTQFKSLPADVRHEILTDLKETRKQSSWGRIHELPTESNEFSGYQMKRLLKRWSIQSSLEETEKEMGGHSLSLGELESLLNDHGVVTKEIAGNRIASDENTRYLYIKDVKKALEKARVENLKTIAEEDDPLPVIPAEVEDAELNEDLEYQRDLNLAIQMSLQQGPSTSDDVESRKKQQTVKQSVSNLQIFSAAKGFMMEYSGLTPAGINEIIMGNKAPDEVSDSEQDQSIISKVLGADAYLTLDSADNPLDEINRKSSKEDVIEKRNLENIQSMDIESIEVASDSESDVLLQNKKEIELIEVTSESESDVLSQKSAPDLNHKLKIVPPKDIKAKDSNSDSEEDFLEVPMKKNVAVGPSQESKTNDESKLPDSNSSNDFSDVPEKNTVKLESVKYKMNDVDDATLKEDSDSDSDFLEVPENTGVKPETKDVLEVVIDVGSKMEDDEDIFSDIFTSTNENKSNKIDLSKLLRVDEKIKTERADSTESSNKKVLQEEDVKLVTLESKNEVSEKGRDVVIEEEDDGNQIEVIKQGGSQDEGNVVKEDKIIPSLSTSELRQMERYLENEKQSLIVERSNKERLANNITDQMYQEAQELLQLFGVPYIVAPMEAEAQCAFLNEANLTDGTITDDSDIWLFGGKTVYKNFFNQSKRVMEFKAENIEHHFNLSRLKLIQLSLLVGSDYTVGLQGIGPVTALEILAAFPSYNENAALSYEQVISGLIRFRTWFKKGRIAGPGRAALRTKLRNLEVTENFPSANVARAYLEPEVENSKEQFSWGQPDIIALTDYAKQKFGWSQKKSEEILKPVIKRLQESKVQSTIKDYFKTKHKINVVDLSDKMSKRVKTAVSRIGQDPNTEEPVKEKKARVSKRPAARKPGKGKKNSTSEASLEIDEDLLELQRVEVASTSKAEEMEEDIKKQLEVNLKRTLHAKRVIHQKERDKSDLVKNKLRAIETFRKSKQGPGFVKKRAKVVRKPKDDAELSESSSDDN